MLVVIMSYDELINIKYHVYQVFIILVGIALIVSLYALKIEVYDVYNTKGYIKNSNLIINIPIDYSDTIINGEYLVINDEKYNFEVKNISDVLLSNNVNYQEVVLEIDSDIPENSIVDTMIYHDKEKVAAKIKELIFGG